MNPLVMMVLVVTESSDWLTHESDFPNMDRTDSVDMEPCENIDEDGSKGRTGHTNGGTNMSVTITSDNTWLLESDGNPSCDVDLWCPVSLSFRSLRHHRETRLKDVNLMEPARFMNEPLDNWRDRGREDSPKVCPCP